MTDNSKSLRMTWLNKARAASRKNPEIEIKRLYRAFGILQAHDCSEHIAKYNTSIASCHCQDVIYHPEIICKHRLAKMMETRMAQ